MDANYKSKAENERHTARGRQDDAPAIQEITPRGIPDRRSALSSMYARAMGSH